MISALFIYRISEFYGLLSCLVWTVSPDVFLLASSFNVPSFNSSIIISVLYCLQFSGEGGSDMVCFNHWLSQQCRHCRSVDQSVFLSLLFLAHNGLDAAWIVDFLIICHSWLMLALFPSFFPCSETLISDEVPVLLYFRPLTDVILTFICCGS